MTTLAAEAENGVLVVPPPIARMTSHIGGDNNPMPWVTEKDEAPMSLPPIVEAAEEAKPDEAPAEEKPEVAWFRRVLASAPRDVPDELDLGAVTAHALASDPPPALGADDAARRSALTALLAALEADNLVMVVDATVFLV